MRIFWMLTALVTPSLQLNFKNFYKADPPSIHNILKDILRVTNTFDVVLTVYNSFDVKDTIVDEVSRTISRNYPTSVIYRDPWVFQPTNMSIRGTGRTLLIHLYISKTAPDYFQAKTIIQITRATILHEHCVKILMITVLKTLNNNLLPFLKHAWSDKLLDTTILEVSGRNRRLLTVHRYNPFSKHYFRQPYVPEVEWYPNKLDNLYGYPISIDVASRPAHCIVNRDRYGYPRLHRGPDSKILEILMNKMNFTMLPCARHSEEILIRVENKSIVGDLGNIQHGLVEMLATTIPFAISDAHFLLGHTRVTNSERWVVTIPVMYETDNHDMHRLLMANAVSVTVVLLFWLTSIILQFDRRIWDPIRIVGTMASISMPRLPVKNAERILYYVLLVAASTFFSNVFVELTKIGLKPEREVTYDTFEELDKSNLTPVMNGMVYWLILGNRNDILGKLREKAILIEKIIDCPEYMMKHRNVSCFIEESMASVFYYKHMYKGEPPIKFTKLYFWEPPVGYTVPLNSPYKTLISDIVHSLETSGIRQKFYTNFFAQLIDKPANQEFPLKEELHEMRTLHQKLIRIPLVGCCVAIVTFLLELLVGCGKSILASTAWHGEPSFVPWMRTTGKRQESNGRKRRREISE